MFIYSITEFVNNMTKLSTNYYATLEGVCEYLKAKQPIDNKMTVRDRETAGQYDISPANLKYLLDQSSKNNFAAKFDITADFTIAQFVIIFTLSIIKVND